MSRAAIIAGQQPAALPSNKETVLTRLHETMAQLTEQLASTRRALEAAHAENAILKTQPAAPADSMTALENKLQQVEDQMALLLESVKAPSNKPAALPKDALARIERSLQQLLTPKPAKALVFDVRRDAADVIRQVVVKES